MNTETAQILCKINNDFYSKQCESFSETRKAPWTGWIKSLEILQDEKFLEHNTLSVLDIACGNLRYESFLKSALPHYDITCFAIDNCDMLVPSMSWVNFQHVDIVEALLTQSSLDGIFDVPLCDLSVSFGFMHHIPGQANREKLLQSLLDYTRVGGYIIVSLWQFHKNETMLQKALATHEEAATALQLEILDENDYVIGWKNKPGVYRYCHSFSETDIDQLILSVDQRANLISRFESDGRTNDLNTYLVLQVDDVT